MAAANQYLTTHFTPAHNQRFAIPAAETGTAFIPWIGSPLAEILCVQEERVVANDNTVRYRDLSLQIPQGPRRFHYVKVTVRVHDYPDGTLAVFHGPRCLEYSVCLVSLVYLGCLVSLVIRFCQPDRPNRPNRPRDFSLVSRLSFIDR